MNSFQRFGIDHLSASSLNKWIASPGWWARQYIEGKKEETNAAMARGTAVENGLAVYLRTQNLDAAVLAATNNYAANYSGPQDSAEEALIEPMVRGLWKWTPPSQLNATQVKIEYWIDHIPIPIIGYLDFAFDGIDVDCKSTKACPSSLGINQKPHIRQVAIYRASRGRYGGLLYVTDKKHAYYEVDDSMMEVALKETRSAALSMYNFLSRCDTKDDVIKSLPLDWGSIHAPKNRELVA